jgi:hypothetical protein
MTGMKYTRGLALAGMVLVSGACAPLDTVLADNGVPYGGRTISGEIRSLDARRGRMQVRENYGSRTHTIQYDNRTRVVYNQRTYSPSSLERGDQVRVAISHDRSGTAWADRVDVQRSVRNDRARVSSRVERLDGTVRSIDSRGGRFTLEHSRNRLVTVQVPRGVSSGDARRLDRLRRGERVRLDVRRYSNNDRTVELVRFR